ATGPGGGRAATARCTRGAGPRRATCARGSMPPCPRTCGGSVRRRATDMARMSMIEAIRSAMDVSMARDERVVVFGEDVGYFGGVFRCTQCLQNKYGGVSS